VYLKFKTYRLFGVLYFFFWDFLIIYYCLIFFERKIDCSSHKKKLYNSFGTRINKFNKNLFFLDVTFIGVTIDNHFYFDRKNIISLVD
jgi:hypothetical protein